jgi:hypothetical protein
MRNINGMQNANLASVGFQIGVGKIVPTEIQKGLPHLAVHHFANGPLIQSEEHVCEAIGRCE